MKRQELEKQIGHKINNKNKAAGTMTLFPKKDEPAIDKREQRRMDQALGLIPFAVKLNEELVAKINAMSAAQKIGVNELVAELLKKGMEK